MHRVCGKILSFQFPYIVFYIALYSTIYTYIVFYCSHPLRKHFCVSSTIALVCPMCTIIALHHGITTLLSRDPQLCCP